MVLFFSSTCIDPPATIYMGRDKVENEDLIKYGDEEDVWFHVDKLSSAHVYLRLPPDTTWERIPTALLDDLSQLVKANSIEGNKKDNQQIIYTPWSNIKKTGDLAIGTVMFHNERNVRRHFVKTRENVIVNRLNKTKREEKVDHEAVRMERQKIRQQAKRLVGNELRNQELAEIRRRKEEKDARDYSSIYSSEAMEAAKREKDRLRRVKAQEREEVGLTEDKAEEDDEGEDGQSDDSFM
ncbi:hypothetical protein CBS101457_003755 [Exobasidium rhododendri]|nr:hypothetical protein CBS101457_003755 [Exobasidium rhododendri]